MHVCGRAIKRGVRERRRGAKERFAGAKKRKVYMREREMSDEERESNHCFCRWSLYCVVAHVVARARGRPLALP